MIDINLRQRRITFKVPGQRTRRYRLKRLHQDPLGRLLYCTFHTHQLIDPNQYDKSGWDYGYVVGGEWVLRQGIQDYFHPHGVVRLTLRAALRPWDAQAWLFVKQYATMFFARDYYQTGPPLIYHCSWSLPPDTVVKRYWGYRQALIHPLKLETLYLDFYAFWEDVDRLTAEQLVSLQCGQKGR